MTDWECTPVNDLLPGKEVELSPRFGYKFVGKKFVIEHNTGTDYVTIKNDLLGSLTVNSSEVRLAKASPVKTKTQT